MELSDKAKNLVSPGGLWWPVTIGLSLALPLVFMLASGGGIPAQDTAQAQEALVILRNELAPVEEAGGEILFISQRQLLTFGNLPGIRLVPEYENIFLMEMAMGNNQFYLERFHQNLSKQRYALIVASEQNTNLQGRTHEFGEENDAWVKRVSSPLLCSYAPKVKLPGLDLVIYAPRPNADCPETPD